MQITNPRNINLVPNIRIKALHNAGFRFIKYALANSDLHILNICDKTTKKYLFTLKYY